MNAPFYGTWGEIPEFTTGYGPLRCEQLASASKRALELRRQFVPMGPFPDFEKIPKTPPYDTTPVTAAAPPRKSSDEISCDGWPFNAATAKALQAQAATDTTRKRSEPVLLDLDHGDLMRAAAQSRRDCRPAIVATQTAGSTWGACHLGS